MFLLSPKINKQDVSVEEVEIRSKYDSGLLSKVSWILFSLSTALTTMQTPLQLRVDQLKVSFQSFSTIQ